MKVEIAGDEQMKDKKNKVAVVTGGSMAARSGPPPLRSARSGIGVIGDRPHLYTTPWFCLLIPSM